MSKVKETHNDHSHSSLESTSEHSCGEYQETKSCNNKTKRSHWKKSSFSEESDKDSDSQLDVPVKKHKHKLKKVKKTKKRRHSNLEIGLSTGIDEAKRYRKYKHNHENGSKGYESTDTQSNVSENEINVKTNGLHVGNEGKLRDKHEPRSKWDSPSEQPAEYRSHDKYRKGERKYTNSNNSRSEAHNSVMARSNLSDNHKHFEKDQRNKHNEYDRNKRRPYREDNAQYNSCERDYSHRDDEYNNSARHKRNHDSRRDYRNDRNDSNHRSNHSNSSKLSSPIGNKSSEYRAYNDRPRFDKSKSNVHCNGDRDNRYNGSSGHRRQHNGDERKHWNHSNGAYSPSNRRKPKEEQEEYTWGKQGQQHDKDKPEIQKDKPNFGLSGKLTEDVNTFNGVVIKYSEPPEARKPKRRWRFYPFKGEAVMPTLYIHRQSCYLIGRDRKVVDLPVDHPSCSKQHAALQYRLVTFTRDNGSTGKRIRPYIIDLESSNGTYVNNNKIEPKKYVELLERDVIKFGFSSREYVLLHENSKDDDQDDDVGSGDDVANITIKQEPK